jgi:hypothetical protein
MQQTSAAGPGYVLIYLMSSCLLTNLTGAIADPWASQPGSESSSANRCDASTGKSLFTFHKKYSCPAGKSTKNIGQARNIF